MGTEVLVGLIGLAGAALGASAAFLGVVYQQRHQARLAKEQRLSALSEQAVDSLISDLEELRSAAWRRPGGRDLGSQERGEWIEATGAIITRIHLSVLRISHKELREMIEAACVLGFGDERTLQERVGLRAPRILIVATCSEAQKCLGYYLRQEPIPETQFLRHARDLMQEAINRSAS